MRVQVEKRFVIAMVSGLVLSGLVVSSPAWGEYQELTELRQASEKVLKEHARQKTPSHTVFFAEEVDLSGVGGT